MDSRAWRDGLVVQSTGGSGRGPGFDSQHPYGGSQLSVPPGSVTLSPLLDPKGIRHTHTWSIDIHTGKTLIHINIF